MRGTSGSQATARPETWDHVKMSPDSRGAGRRCLELPHRHCRASGQRAAHLHPVQSRASDTSDTFPARYPNPTRVPSRCCSVQPFCARFRRRRKTSAGSRCLIAFPARRTVRPEATRADRSQGRPVAVQDRLAALGWAVPAPAVAPRLAAVTDAAVWAAQAKGLSAVATAVGAVARPAAGTKAAATGVTRGVAPAAGTLGRGAPAVGTRVRGGGALGARAAGAAAGTRAAVRAEAAVATARLATVRMD